MPNSWFVFTIAEKRILQPGELRFIDLLCGDYAEYTALLSDLTRC